MNSVAISLHFHPFPSSHDFFFLSFFPCLCIHLLLAFRTATTNSIISLLLQFSISNTYISSYLHRSQLGLASAPPLLFLLPPSPTSFITINGAQHHHHQNTASSPPSLSLLLLLNAGQLNFSNVPSSLSSGEQRSTSF